MPANRTKATFDVGLEDIIVASHALKDAVRHTPLMRDDVLSQRYNCNVYLKREDLQVVRSFKIRGAYNFMRNLDEKERARGVVCASAGNHAQGVAWSCRAMQIRGTIFMPTTTPRQKVTQVQRFGGDRVEIVLAGDTFDDTLREALAACEREGASFIHPFDHPWVVAGQGTIGPEILQDLDVPADYVFAAVGGGGLISGLGVYIKHVRPQTKLIGVEPEGAASMKAALERGGIVTLENIDPFVDGAAVKRAGELTYRLVKETVDGIAVVPEGKVCTTILEMYNDSAIVVEPAGALPVAALDQFRDEIAGKTVVCVVSGGNNDIDRMPEIKEKSLIHEGLKHYFLINFPQRAGALREFLEHVLGPTDDITRFEYIKKTNMESGPALVGIELKNREDYGPLVARMNARGVSFSEINRDSTLFHYLV